MRDERLRFRRAAFSPWGVISGWRAVQGERVPERGIAVEWWRLGSLTVSAAVLADLLQLHDRKLPGDKAGEEEKTINKVENFPKHCSVI